MFDRPESLLDDIDQLTETQMFPAVGSALSSSEVGQSIIMLALGRMPAAHVGLLVADDKVSDLRQQTARQLVAKWFLAREATLYASLGVAPECSHEVLRENYRRLIGLVHPDTRPVGFPEDSASRVNFAYSIVSDEERRASYDASLALVKQQSAFPPRAVAEVASPRQTLSPNERSLIERIRATIPQIQFGNGLLAIAALILVPTGIAFYLIAEREAHPQIVEAKPRTDISAPVALKPDKPVVNSANSASPTMSSSNNSTASIPNASAAIAPVPIPLSSNPIRPLPAAVASASQPLSPNTNSLRSPPSAVAAVPPQRQPDASPLAPSRAISDAKLSVQTEIAAPPKPIARDGNLAAPAAGNNNLPSLAPVASNASANVDTASREANVYRAANAATIRSASIVAAAAIPTAPSEPRVSPADAGDVLVTLGSAYESGSIAAFSKVFAPAMAGRRQVLSNYERVFQQTRQRSIRFTDFKHKAIGERLVTSGYAVVTTVDNDNRASNHRIFLEIDISRTPEGLKIERLHNFPMN